MNEYYNYIRNLLNYQLFPLGQSRVTLLGLISFSLLLFVLIYLSGKLRRLLVNFTSWPKRRCSRAHA